jgi:hypothetical protein
LYREHTFRLNLERGTISCGLFKVEVAFHHVAKMKMAKQSTRKFMGNTVGNFY